MKNLHIKLVACCFFLVSGIHTYAQDTIFMATQTRTINSAVFYDTGGANANYSNMEGSTLTIYPESSNSFIKVVFSEFNTENNYDYLRIYNGNSISAPLIGSYCGTSLPPTIQSSAADGSLTLKFTSDGTQVRAGWKAIISCYQEKPMVFDTAIIFQELPHSLKIGKNNILAYCLNVKTKDILSPLNLKRIRFKTDCPNISRIDLRYSGLEGKDTSIVPLAELTDICSTQQFTLNKSLVSGDNFFWFYISIKETATPNDLLQFELQDISVQDSVYPILLPDSLIKTSIIEKYYSGIYSTNLTLGPGVVNIDENMTIGENASLSILPGTTMYFTPPLSSGDSHKLIVKGSIHALGTLNNPISFTSVRDSAFSNCGFSSISFEKQSVSTDTSFFNHCIFENTNWSSKGTITIDSFSNVSISNCIIENSEGYGIYNNGILHVDNTSILKNYGGIFNAGMAEIIGTSIYNNYGSGIYNKAHLKVSFSTISKNKAESGANGGDGWAGSCSCYYSMPGGNGGNGGMGNNGGGIFNDHIAEINNSTITENFSGEGGIGGRGGRGGSGFCTVFIGTLSYPSPCFTSAGMSGTNGRQGYGGGISNSGDLKLKNSIVAYNKRPDNTFDDIYGTVNTSVNNLFSLNSNVILTNDSIGNKFVDPLVDALGNNGGITPTCALLTGSPAINANTMDLDSFPILDQRGFTRLDSPDIGSFEYGAVKFKTNMLDTICEGLSFMGHTSTGLYNHYYKTTDGYDSLVVLSLLVKPLPLPAGIISGDTIVCKGSSLIYKIPAIQNATSYIWTLPTGAEGTSTADTILVHFSSSSVSDTIRVHGQNDCGVGPERALAITVNDIPEAADSILGPDIVCKSETVVTYSTPPIEGATSYIWTLPAGAEGTSTTDSISVHFSHATVSDTIRVQGQNDCGLSAESYLAIRVNDIPEAAGAILGPVIVCKSETVVTYSTPPIEGATSYIWTLPAGAEGTSTTDSISVHFSHATVSDTIRVQGQNDCGLGAENYLAIRVNDIPKAAGAILGPDNVCKCESLISYSIPPIEGATSYIWTLPSGTTGSSTTDSLLVHFNSSSVSDTLRVRGQNDCGVGVESTLTIRVNNIPDTPEITINNDFLQSSATIGNQWYLSDSVILNAINDSYLPSQSGEYFAIVTLNNCSSLPSNKITFTYTSVEGVLNDHCLQVFPNPTSEEIRMIINQPFETDYIVKIYDNVGSLLQMLKKDKFETKFSINISKYASGLYLIRIYSKEKCFQVKVLKE